MADVTALLAPLAPRIEAELRPRLAGAFGGMLREFLPQVWVFRTERGVASLTVGRDGAVAVVPSAAEPADVTVEVGHDRLASALATRGQTVADRRRTAVPFHNADVCMDVDRARFLAGFLAAIKGR